MDRRKMTYHYTMCGLDYVYLLDGYTIQDTDYGSGVSIKHADELDGIIAFYVITSPARLRGQEVRFLRSLIDFSQSDLANHLGVKRITVARWESEPNASIPGPADRATRILVAHELFEATEALAIIASMFPEIADLRRDPVHMSYLPDSKTDEPSLFSDDEKEGDGWRPTKVATN
jgi:DNA-binding transcriptional regulator YiaG